MQETLLALGALMIIMLIAVNQQRSTIHIHEQVYIREVSQARDDFAVRLLEGISNEMSFDELTMALTDIPTNVSSLSDLLGPDSGETVDSTFDDIDDFDAYRDTFIHVISADTFFFDVTFSVTYIDDDNTITASKTFAKEISALVTPLQDFGRNGNSLDGVFSKTKVIYEDF